MPTKSKLHTRIDVYNAIDSLLKKMYNINCSVSVLTINYITLLEKKMHFTYYRYKHSDTLYFIVKT